ncbi:hypothetical protein RJT34_28395 [Clitoria ternatea]|uniref:C-JID domain-containing protein n=1 Tax=Clitoria ternatea TaxID=43366 RepID=A0AAN9FDB1_CLITE
MEHCYGVVFSWMLQIFQEVYLQSSSLRGEVKIVIPGTLIPSWFNNQNVGDSISIDLSPVMEDPNWIGVTCCTVFVAHDDPTNLRTPPRPRYSYYDFNQDDDAGIGSTIRGKNLWGISHLIPILLKKEEVTVDSDHLFILFLTREEFINIVNDVNANDKMEFKTFVPQPQGLHMEVKCCGYRWVFEEDLQHLNPNTMLCNGNSTTQMHKLLTIE